MDPNDGRVVSNFVVQAIRGEPITIYGDGSLTRSCLYVDDMIECMIRVMKSRFHRASKYWKSNRVQYD